MEIIFEICLNGYSAYYIIFLSAAAVECQIKKKQKTHIVDFTNELKVLSEFLLQFYLYHEHHDVV